MILKIYTDGACSGNGKEDGGSGGWAAVLLFGASRKEISGHVGNTTNNRMELQSVIEGLKAITKPVKVEVYSDSTYVVNAVNNGWIENWKKNGWRNAAKAEVKNQDLWHELVALNDVYNPKYIKVKGHSDDVNNNRADELAVAASLKAKTLEE